MKTIKENDNWSHRFFIIALSMQLSVFGIIEMRSIGIEFFPFGEIILFIYLIFLPGMLMLKAIGFHDLDIPRVMLFSSGLSLSIIMILGALINFVYPFFGISNPISIVPFLATMSIVVLSLMIFCFLKRKEGLLFKWNFPLNSRMIKSVGFLCLLPLLAIIGTYFAGDYPNLFLLILISLIALVPILIGFDRLKGELYPFAIFTVAIALLYHNSLMFSHLWGFDIHFEYYAATSTLENGYWNPTIPSDINAMLDVVIIAPVLSSILNMNLVWVFKIIYPFFFALVPVAMYMIFKQYLNQRTAFLSVFFFVSFFVFYQEMIQIARQEVAELFLVLIVLMMVERRFNSSIKYIVLIIFAFSLVASHYGLSFIVLYLLIIGVVINKLIGGNERRISLLTPSFALLFALLCYAWYTTISSSEVFGSWLIAWGRISTNIFTDLFSSSTSQGVYLIGMQTQSIAHEISRYLQLCTQILIVVGVTATILFREKRNRFGREIYAFSLLSFVLLVASVMLPYVASTLNITRVVQISLIFLAPFCILGGSIFLKQMSIILQKENRFIKKRFIKKPLNVCKILSLFFAVFLLFNTGFIYEIVNDKQPTSFSLSSYKGIDSPVYNNVEISSGEWLIRNYNEGKIIVDSLRYQLMGEFGSPFVILPSNMTEIPKGDVLYMGSYNIMHSQLLVYDKIGNVASQTRYINSTAIELSMDRILDNGGSRILYS